jgi:hypothetical protein
MGDGDGVGILLHRSLGEKFVSRHPGGVFDALALPFGEFPHVGPFDHARQMKFYRKFRNKFRVAGRRVPQSVVQVRDDQGVIPPGFFRDGCQCVQQNDAVHSAGNAHQHARRRAQQVSRVDGLRQSPAEDSRDVRRIAQALSLYLARGEGLYYHRYAAETKSEMRPVPSTKHVLSVVIFLAFSVGSGYLAWKDHRLSEEQISFATAAVKRHQPNLMKYDTVYGDVHADGRLRQLHTPVFLSLMELSLIPTNYEDLTLPFRVGVAPFVFLYLCGMYALLWRQTRSSTISAYVAVLSTTVIHTFGNWFWGLGTLASITPQGILVAVSPLLLLSYLQNAHRPQVVVTFGAIGLCANLHLISAMNLALILLAVHLGRNRFSPRALFLGVGCVVFFAVGASPYLLYFILLRRSIAAAAGNPAVSTEAVLYALRISELAVLYPEMLRSLLNWSLYVTALAVPAGVLLWRIERFRTRNLDLWLWMAGMALFVALGLHGLNQWLGRVGESAPPMIDFVQASTWVMLPLYVIFAQALTHLFRIVRKHRRYLQYAFGLFLLAWMLPSDNLRLVRHEIYDVSTRFFDEADRPMRVQEIDEQEADRAELAALADWAGSQIDVDAVFVTDQSEFRMMARRGVLVCRDDVRLFYYLAPWMLGDWTDLLLRQYQWLSSPLAPRKLCSAVSSLARTPLYHAVPEWYVLLPADPAATSVAPLREIPSEKWGKYWRVLRVDLQATPGS